MIAHKLMKNDSLLSKAGKKIIPKRFHYSLRLLYYKLDNLLKHGSSDFFISVEVETITACNRRCSHCPNSIFDRGLIKNKRLLDTELFFKIIEELSKLKFIGKFSPHFFGEPLLDKRLPDLIAYARKKLPLAYLVIYTNGDLLTLDLYKKLSKAGINEFFLTQHSSTMPPTIKKLFEYRKLNGEDTVRINYALFNKDITPLNMGGLLHHIKPPKEKVCTRPSRTLNIDCDGNVILCCQDYHSSIKLGNIKNESILDIWGKPYYKRLRKDLRKGIFNLKICQKCLGKNKNSTLME